jgi:hypothetical protein
MCVETPWIDRQGVALVIVVVGRCCLQPVLSGSGCVPSNALGPCDLLHKHSCQLSL